MIDLGQPPLHSESVTVFPDHADPARFLYLPDSPRLAVRASGQPELSLLKYRFDPGMHKELGAGMLAFTVDLGVDDAVLERIRGRLRNRFGLTPTLSAVTADGGRCEVVIVDRVSEGGGTAPPSSAGSDAAPDSNGGSGLVERILGAASPSLYGNNAAAFMAVLSAEGVALIEQALLKGGLPVGVVYALEVTALRPAMRAQITARWQDVYDYYENCLHGGKLLLATDIGTTVQDLVHSEALSVAVDDFLPPDQKDDTYRRAVDQMQTYVLEQFFKPTLAQSPPPPDSGTDGLATIGNAIKDIAGFFSITYALRQINRSELKTLSYQLNVASAERLTLAPQGTFPVLLASTGDGAPIDASKLITEVTPAASEQMDFDVGAAIDLDGEEIDHLEVFIRYGERSETLLLDGTTPRRSVTFWYQQEQGLAIHYRYEVHFKLGAGNTQDVLKSADASTEDRIVRIDPRALYQRTGVRTVAEGIPFARFPTVIVDLKVDDPAGDWSTNQTLQLDAAHTEASWTLRSALEARIMFQRRLRYVDAQGTETAVDWDYAEPGILIVGNPYPEVLDVQIVGSARFDTEVRRLIVELRLKSQADKVVTKVLTKDQPFATWSVPLENCEKRAYEYRVTIHTVGNEAHEGQWLSGADGTLVVGERIARLRQVQMVFVGRSLKDLQLLGVKVRFVFDDADAGLHAENEMLVQDASKPLNWSYPVADQARQSFIYQLSLIHADGRIEQKDPVTTADLLVVCPMT